MWLFSSNLLFKSSYLFRSLIDLQLKKKLLLTSLFRFESSIMEQKLLINKIKIFDFIHMLSVN